MPSCWMQNFLVTFLMWIIPYVKNIPGRKWTTYSAAPSFFPPRKYVLSAQSLPRAWNWSNHHHVSPLWSPLGSRSMDGQFLCGWDKAGIFKGSASWETFLTLIQVKANHSLAWLLQRWGFPHFTPMGNPTQNPLFSALECSSSLAPV